MIRVSRRRGVGWLAGCAVCAVMMGGCSSDSATPSGPGGSSPSTSLTAQNVSSAIQAHELSGANFDGLTVSIRAGGDVVVVVTTKPSTTLSAADVLSAVAIDALSVADAVSGFHGVGLIHVQFDTRFSDSSGAVRVEPAAWIEMTAPALASLAQGNASSALRQEPLQVFAKATAYDIVPPVWYGLPSGTQGGLPGNAVGHALLSPLPN